MKTSLRPKFYITLISFFLITLVSCSEEYLKSSKYDDEQELSKLRSELQKMSDQIVCENAADWRIVPIGAKACGGANSFIAYSIKIDTVEF